MRLADYIKNRQSKGYFYFTTEQAQTALGVSIAALRAAIRRFQQRGELAEPVRGFHLILPPEHQKQGCLPALYFIDELASYLDLPYYVCLLSAGSIYGAAHQKPQVLQVMIPAKRLPIKCGQVVIQWVTNKQLSSMPTQKIKTDYGYVIASTPEVTAKDLVTYPHRAAGMSNVVTVLSELVDKMRVKELKALINSSGKRLNWIQRLGYCLDFVGEKKLSQALYERLKQSRFSSILLCSRGSITTPIFNKKWRLYVNDQLEIDE